MTAATPGDAYVIEIRYSQLIREPVKSACNFSTPWECRLFDKLTSGII
jgi:hypothetical protein